MLVVVNGIAVALYFPNKNAVRKQILLVLRKIDELILALDSKQKTNPPQTL